MTTCTTALVRTFCALAVMLSIYGTAEAQENRITSRIVSADTQASPFSLIPAAQETSRIPRSQDSGRKRKTSDEEETEQPSRQPSPSAQPERAGKVEMNFRYWLVDSRATVAVADSAGGLTVGARASLDLDTKNAPEGRLAWQFTRRNKLRIDYLHLSNRANAADVISNLSGDDIIPGDIASGLSARLKTRQLRIGYAWQGIRVGDKFRVGPLLEWRGFLFDAVTTTPALTPGGTPTVESDRFGLAMLNLGMDLNIFPHRRVEIVSTLSGIPIAGLGRVIDVDNEVKFHLEKHFNLSIGYRYMRLRGDSGPNFAELRMRGPVVGVGIRF